MSYADERRIRDQIASLDAQRTQLVAELGVVVADDLWAAGSLVQAVATAADHGVDPVDYARGHGLSRDEAAELVRQIPVDPR